MESHARALVIVLTLIAASTAPVCLAQNTEVEAPKPAFPYLAEITADDIYVRSGPGTNYYFTGKLNKGDQVKIVSDKFSWSQIVPPEGSYSWIAAQYVQVGPDNSLMGTVAGDAVRVYAGSDSIQPMHSTTMQGKLDKGAKVTLLGDEQDGYYKIAPPDFAYLWVSTKYTSPLASIAAPAPADAEPAPQTQAGSEPGQPALVPTTIVTEEQRLKEYYDLKEKVEAERAKPIDRQNYTSLRKALKTVAEDKNAGKAARYARFVLAQIDRYELARQVAQTMKLQELQFVDTQQRIEKARTAKLNEYLDLGTFAAVGRFTTSSIYGDKREPLYRMVDEEGKTACYALPTGAAENIDLNKFLSKKVGLLGTIEPHPASGGALVQFTDIVLIRK